MKKYFKYITLIIAIFSFSSFFVSCENDDSEEPDQEKCIVCNSTSCCSEINTENCCCSGS